MINHNKIWQLYDSETKSFFEKSFINIFENHSWYWYDFFYKEIYDLEFSPTKCIYEMFDCIIDKDDVVVDLGANVGFFTEYAAKKSKKVIAVEGGDALFSCLVKNTYSNNNIEYLNANVVSEKSNFETTWSCPTKINTTISNIFDLYKLEKIDFLKMDIEGCEYDIFKHIDKNLIKKIKKISLEAHYKDRDSELIANIGKPNASCFDWYITNHLQKTYYFY